MTKSILHKVDGIEKHFVIRWANNHDLRQIHDWLLEEDALGIHGNFLCNWNLTQKSFEEGNLLVLLDGIEDIPIAYQWGQLLSSGVLQIRDDWRRKGLGRIIVEYCIELALQNDEMVLQIECKPSTSIPFWKTMGFTIFEGELGNNPRGIRVLSKELNLPAIGKPVSVMISIFPEESKWQEDVPAIASYQPDAILAGDEKVYLANRIAFPFSFSRRNRDPVIEIIVNGSLIYRNKAKYPEAQDHGVMRCRNGFYVDVVTK